MSKDILLVVEAMSNEKGVDREVIFEATEAALEIATKEHLNQEMDIRVIINRKNGEYATFRRWLVSNEPIEKEPQESLDECSLQQLPLSQAKQYDPHATVGQYILQPMESISFSRIATQKAKQVILKKVLEAERAQLLSAYQKKIGQLITGVVKRVTRDFVTIDLGSNTEAILYRTDMLSHDAFRNGDRIRTLLHRISTDGYNKQPQILLSRTCQEMLIELFKIEVPEIGEEVIEIKAVARDPGSRAKIAVKTNDGRIDPIGACVGMRGTRVQAVSGELGGERIDIVLWDDHPAQLVINAMSPAEVASIVVDEEMHTMDLGIRADQLSQAIGRHGQNVRLVSELTGWTLNVMSQEAAEEKSTAESEKLIRLFQEKLQINIDIANTLVIEGFSSLEEIAYVQIDELLNIKTFDPEIVKTLRERAKASLLTQAIAKEQALEIEPAKDLLEMEGIDTHLAYRLASHCITTREALAEQSIDDLLEIGGINKKVAATLIMTARKIWFDDAANNVS